MAESAETNAYAVISHGSVGSNKVVKLFTDYLEASEHFNWKKMNPFCNSVRLVKVNFTEGETLRETEGEGAKYERRLKDV